jgi:putative mRNA 3-end processing factor
LYGKAVRFAFSERNYAHLWKDRAMTNAIPRLKSEQDGISITYGNGIRVNTPSFSVALDPRSASECDYTFVSHAHIDHVHVPNGRSKVIASEETKELARMRGYDLGKSNDEVSGIELINSGHILGSKAILIEDRILYTGDLSTRDRAFLKGCRGVDCETLIIESTYGRGHYVFPETEAVISRVNQFISECFDRCRPVVLTGYPLGKAQLISYLFDVWEPVYLHESIYKMNNGHIKLGIGLKEFDQFTSTKEFYEKLDRGPWILIAPSTGGKSTFVRTMKEKYNAAIASFTGWAVDSRYSYSMSLDRAFPLSDHCDFQELVTFVKNCDPSKIYTMHGFSSEFASHLRRLGFDAEPLEGQDEPQRKLTSFAH